jgi:GDPmannose 4,6-dehydratase
MFACSGILFNHESPIRGETFVTRKITRGLARIAVGLDETLYLGNLNALRDWGHAADYAKAQWLMLQQPQPDDFVIATGVQHSVREFVEKSAQRLGFDIQWQGSGVDEQGVDRASGRTLVRIDPRYFRPSEVDSLLGDATKAHAQLGWSMEKTFDDVIAEMVDADLELARRDSHMHHHGFKIFRRHE